MVETWVQGLKLWMFWPGHSVLSTKYCLDHGKETVPNHLIKIALIYPLSSNLKGKAMLYKVGVDSDTYANLTISYSVLQHYRNIDEVTFVIACFSFSSFW